MQKEKTPPSRETSFLVLILAIALLLRLTGIGFGLPLRLHPDEWSQVLPALSMFEGSFNPNLFFYPSFTIYFYFILFKIASILLPGIFKITTSNASFWLLARIISAVLGTATVLAAYKLALKLYDGKTGLVAAFLIAIFPLSVRHSHFAIVDIPMTLFILISLYFMCGKNDGELSYKSLILAGIFGGLAASAKYSAFPLICVLFIICSINCASDIKKNDTSEKRMPVTMALLFFLGVVFLVLSFNPLKSQINASLTEIFSDDGVIEKGDLGYIFLNRLNGGFRFLGFFLPTACVVIYFIPSLQRYLAINFFDRRIIIPPLIFVLVFFAASPYIIIDFGRFVYDLKFAVKVTTLGFYEDKLWSTASYLTPLQNFILIFKNNAGIFLSILFPAGLLFSLKKRFLPLILWITVYIYTISSMKLTMARFLLPLTSLFIIFASGAITEIARFVREKSSWKPAEIIFILAMLLTCSQKPLSQTVAVEKYFLKPSVLKIAYRWIEKNIPEGKQLMLAGIVPDMRLSQKHYRVAKMEKPDNVYDISEKFSIEDADYFITGKQNENPGKLEAKLIKRISSQKSGSTGRDIFIYKLQK